MNYELALELKEAGFLFHGIAEGKEAWDGKAYIEEGTLLAYALPTLEELIEACGEGFNTLSRDASTSTTCWVVNNYSEIDAPEETVLGWFEGKTPTEAVARLWLVINKKT